MVDRELACNIVHTQNGLVLWKAFLKIIQHVSEHFVDHSATCFLQCTITILYKAGYQFLAFSHGKHCRYI